MKHESTSRKWFCFLLIDQRIYLISLGSKGMVPYWREQSQSASVTTRTRLLSGTCCTTNILKHKHCYIDQHVSHSVDRPVRVVLLAASTLDETVGLFDGGVVHEARIGCVTRLHRLHLLLLMSWWDTDKHTKIFTLLQQRINKIVHGCFLI